MRIRNIGRRGDTIELQMTPMIDVVFLLLIYFMVVTVFQQDIGMPFVLPAAISGPWPSARSPVSTTQRWTTRTRVVS